MIDFTVNHFFNFSVVDRIPLYEYDKRDSLFKKP